MSASSLASLREIFTRKNIAIQLLRAPTPKHLNCRQQLQRKYEPSLPTFSSFLEEIEWRLSDISSQFYKGNETSFTGIAYHWIKVAIFAGYQLDKSGYLIVKSKRNPSTIPLVQRLKELWEEVLTDCLIAIRLKEVESPQEKKTFICIESNGKKSLLKATDLFDIVEQIFGVGKRIDYHERKRCVSMLRTVRSYRHLSTCLYFQAHKDFIAITQNRQFGFYEIVVKEQA